MLSRKTTSSTSSSSSFLLPLPLLVFLLPFLTPVSISASPALSRRAAPVEGFYNASSWLTLAENTYPEGLGEPINAVVSANSDAFVLTDEGFMDWAVSVEFAGECLGQEGGSKQKADLGDGNGLVNQTGLLRYDYGDPTFGTCKETIQGGNHFRYWIQNGTTANSGARFLALSVEMNLTLNHDIIPNGYDLGRDWLVGNATVASGTRSPLTNRTFSTTSTLIPGFLPANSSVGINHNLESDGNVAVLVVQVTSNGTATTASATGAGTRVGLKDVVSLEMMMLAAAVWVV